MRWSMGLAVAAIIATTPAAASERICGWYANPTPGDLLITDRHGDWWITGGGAGADAKGIDKAPQLDGKQFVETNVPGSGRGYGCACMTVETNTKARRITRVISGETLPLARCRADKSLPRPG